MLKATLLCSALVVLPLASLSAQSATSDDNSSSGNRVAWFSAAAVASGASLFAAFTHGGSSQTKVQTAQPAAAPFAITGQTSPTTDSTVIHHDDTPVIVTHHDDTPVTDTHHTDTPIIETHHTDPGEVDNTHPPVSTVPEPSSLALLATGLVGLVPLIRRKK